MKKLLLMASMLGFMTCTLSAQSQAAPGQAKSQTPPAKAKMEVVKDKTPAPAKMEAKPADGQKMKSDGTPDKRFKGNKNLKKDGTPDKRYKESKKDAPAKTTK